MAEKKTIPETASERSARILARVEAEQLRPDLELQYQANLDWEKAKRAVIRAVEQYTSQPVGIDVEQMLLHLAELSDAERAAREHYMKFFLQD